MVATGILCATCRLVMTIICAKQYFNPTRNDKVMAWKRMRDRLMYNAATICSPKFLGHHNKLELSVSVISIHLIAAVTGNQRQTLTN